MAYQLNLNKNYGIWDLCLGMSVLRQAGKDNFTNLELNLLAMNLIEVMLKLFL